MTSLLTVKKLSKTYDGKQVLRDINLRVSKGERVALIGPNGSGKTTLIRMLGLLEAPTAGEIYFMGNRISGVREKWRLRRKMAVVFQRPAVLNTTVYGNLAAGLKVRGEMNEAVDKKVKRALEDFNLKGLEGKNARTLSGGEKQLLAVARAVVLEPLLLLLDEPTSNLDPENTALVEEALKATESTVVMTSPNASDAVISNRAIHMVDCRRAK